MSIIRRAHEAFSDITGPVLAAVSGGGDSVALVHLLHETGMKFAIAHFTHHIRDGVARDEQRFVQHLAERCGVPFFHGEADVPAITAQRGGNMEQIARDVRYSWLHNIATRNNYQVILTAHTQNDNSETVLQQLLRGSAATTGIPAARGMVQRPLLTFTGDELRTYLTAKNERWLEDVTNFDTNLTRVWLRRAIIPQLTERYPNMHDVLTRYSTLQRSQRDALEHLALAWFPSLPMRVNAMQNAPRAITATALALHLTDHGIAVNDELITDIFTAITDHAAWRRDVTAHLSIAVQYGQFDVVHPVPELHGHSAPWRTIAPGDKLNLRAGTKLLSDFLIDEKIPAIERSQLLVRENDNFIVEAAGLFRVQSGVVIWTDTDRHFMTLALQKARLAQQAGEVPVGAVVVSAQREVIGVGYNQRGEDNPLGHAEIAAIQAAAHNTGDWRLSGATLYVTLEPCPMCAGAILQTHIRKIVYGADNTRDGAAGTIMNVFGGNWKRRVTVVGGILAHKSTKLLQTAFETARMR